MAQPRFLAVPVLLAVTLGASLAAQEVRLTDGRVLYGTTTKIADGLRITTQDGPVVVDATEIARVRTKSALRAELKRLAAGRQQSAFAQLELARHARRLGLTTDMWRHLDACLETCREDGATRRRLDRFLGSLEHEVLPPKERDGSTAKKVRNLVRRSGLAKRSKQHAIAHVLANLDGANADIRKQARRAGSPQCRMTALRALDIRNEPGNAKFLFRTAILDSSRDVRAQVARLPLAQAYAADGVQYLAPGLHARDNKIATRTAEAFANLGNVSAVPILVNASRAVRKASGSGGSTRGYMAVINQQAYIRDFDVEVAQAAFIADPKIDVLQSGVVLDVTVHAVNTVRYRLKSFRGALERLTGSDPGKVTTEWNSWMASLSLPAEQPRGKQGPTGPKASTAKGRAARAAGKSDSDSDAGKVWVGRHDGSGTAVVGTPVGTTPMPTSGQSPSGGINTGSLGVSSPGQPALPGMGRR